MSCISSFSKILIPCRCIPISMDGEEKASSGCCEVLTATLFASLVVGAAAFGSSYGFYRLYKTANIAPWVRSLAQVSMGVSAAVGVIAIAGYLLRGGIQGTAAICRPYLRGKYHSTIEKGEKRDPVPVRQYRQPTPSETRREILDQATEQSAKKLFSLVTQLFEKKEPIKKGEIQNLQKLLYTYRNLISTEVFERHIQYVEDTLNIHTDYFKLKEEVASIRQPITRQQQQELLKRSRDLTDRLGNIQSPAIPYDEYGLKTLTIYSKQTTEFFALSTEIARLSTVESEQDMKELLATLEAKGSKVSDVVFQKDTKEISDTSSSSDSDESSSDEDFLL